jgi:homoserine dehydrogenase
MPSSPSKINVALLGLGGVGSCTLSILQSPLLSPKFTLVALANSSSSLLASPSSSIPTIPSSTSASKWLNEQSNRQPLDLPALLSKLSMVQGETVVVDNTSSENVANLYPTMLRLGLHVCTPNKKAWSGDLKLWEDILAAKGEKGSLCYGESTVGAGLPILTTLKDLVETGDEVVKVEGVLSGTRQWKPLLSNHLTPSLAILRSASSELTIRNLSLLLT